MKVESISWLTWSQSLQESLPEGRVYLGAESCENQLASLDEMVACIRLVLNQNHPLTLVTPVMSENGLQKLTLLLDNLAITADPIEVVCNDYGVFETVLQYPFCQPVIGRLLSGQCTDPRFAGIVDEELQLSYEKEMLHLDGTAVNLTYAPPGKEYLQHIKTPAVFNRDWLAYLWGLGVRRCEVSNLLQGMQLEVPEGWKITLHVPKVIIAVRRCILKKWEDCSAEACQKSFILTPPGFSLPIYLSSCEAYYLNDRFPDLKQFPAVDRVVQPAPITVK